MFLVLTLKSGDKLATMKAFRCLSQIVVAQEDDETALSLFRVALDGLTFMDVHQWKADCIVRMADITQRRGDMMKTLELWKAARPLFHRSSQAKEVTQIDRKLTAVDLVTLEKYGKHKSVTYRADYPSRSAGGGTHWREQRGSQFRRSHVLIVNFT
jgi:hypothetical protein